MGVAFHFVATRPVIRGQRIWFTLLLLATFWHVHDVWRWREDRAQAARLEEAVRLREAERALFQGTVEIWPALVDERARLKRALEDLLYPNRYDGPGCWTPNYLMQISSLIERIANEEHDAGLELRRVWPGRTSRLPGDLHKFPSRTFEMSVNGRYATIVRLLQRLQLMEYDRLVTLSRVVLSPHTSRWDGVWTARISVTVYLYAPDEP